MFPSSLQYTLMFMMIYLPLQANIEVCIHNLFQVIIYKSTIEHIHQYHKQYHQHNTWMPQSTGFSTKAVKAQGSQTCRFARRWVSLEWRPSTYVAWCQKLLTKPPCETFDPRFKFKWGLKVLNKHGWTPLLAVSIRMFAGVCCHVRWWKSLGWVVFPARCRPVSQ